MSSSQDVGVPLLVLVSGAPGAGKTTLATTIARSLHIFHLHRDGIWDGLRFTVARGRGDSVGHGVDVWYAALNLLLKAGVSVVADGTLYKDWDEAKVAPLLAVSNVVNVHCRANRPIDRYRARKEEDGYSDVEVAAAVSRVVANEDRVIGRLSLGCPYFEIDTSDGYEPPLAELLKELVASRL